MKNKTKKIIVIILITIVLVALGVALPIIVKGDNNTAQTSQVLSGKTFSTGSVVGLTGAMKDFSGQIPEVTATAADEDYIATIDLDDGYYESVKINAKPIYDAGVTSGTNSLTGGNAAASHILKDKTAYVNGKLVTGSMSTLTSSNFSGTHSSTTAGAASTYTVKSTSAGYVANNTTVNSISAGTSPEIATTSATGVQTIKVKPGYYNNIKVNQTNAYNQGKKDGATTHTGTYTLTASETGKKDLGASHTYRYVDASKVYAKGKADATITFSTQTKYTSTNNAAATAKTLTYTFAHKILGITDIRTEYNDGVNRYPEQYYIVKVSGANTVQYYGTCQNQNGGRIAITCIGY